MPLTNAERQRLWRERHRGEPRGNAAMLAELAAIQARVAQLSAELAARPKPAPGKPPRRVRDAVAVLKRERDELAERLATVEAYQPLVTAKAQAWIAQVDAPPRRRG
jgi:hypothetical protein